MAISSGLRILEPFTTDKSDVSDAIRQTEPRGRTPLYASIYIAVADSVLASAVLR